MRNVINFIGNSIAIVLCIVLLYVLIKHFQDHEIFRKMKISAYLVFATLVIYDLSSMMRKSFVPTDLCVVQESLSLSPFLLARGALYYFFIIRMELTFSGSGIEYSPKLVKGLKITTIVVYGIFAIYFIATASNKVYNEEEDSCKLGGKLVMYYVAMVIYALVDFVLGVIICSLYLARLYALYKLIKASSVIDHDKTMETEAERKGQEEVLRIIQKQGKLAYVAYISTLFFIYFGPPSTGLAMGYMDSIINGLCVYCTFNWNAKTYQYLCDCNGNKYLQYLFCSVCGCCCCNQVRTASNNVEVKALDSTSNAQVASQTSKSDNAMDSKASSDTTNQIDLVLH
eukprot:217268_1